MQFFFLSYSVNSHFPFYASGQKSDKKCLVCRALPRSTPSASHHHSVSAVAWFQKAADLTLTLSSSPLMVLCCLFRRVWIYQPQNLPWAALQSSQETDIPVDKHANPQWLAGLLGEQVYMISCFKIKKKKSRFSVQDSNEWSGNKNLSIIHSFPVPPSFQSSSLLLRSHPIFALNIFTSSSFIPFA